MVKLVATAIMQSGERAIVLSGVAGLSIQVLMHAISASTSSCPSTSDESAVTLISYAKENILFVDKVSHEYIFPLVKCTVHHGGAGTTHAALRAGVPTIITPIFLDQFCHSKAVNIIGVGIGYPYAFQKVTAQSLAQSIIQVTTSDDMIQKSKDIAKHVRSEGGKAAAANVIEKILLQNTDVTKTTLGFEGFDHPFHIHIDAKKSLILPEIAMRIIFAIAFLVTTLFFYVRLEISMEQYGGGDEEL
eukprot:CAMPEP_0204631600 /NCGR_PEP_ID=MMETSP0717-20131115/23046_1 /ASSEMBLY_ACC=CAM_ASM_000666 /TAXON_ID=230516 /ORGANISM="Chaetoceros curvisetus" /LENGTH=245 /DNA_ID=CAMNT_0051649201 /DNA_START=30 /DNA_END=767 /DNA_ORIENTATION=-